MKKKLLSLLCLSLSLLLLLGAVSCTETGKDPDPTPTPTEEVKPTSEPTAEPTQEVIKLSFEDYIAALSADAFASPLTPEKTFGLTDSAVGIEKTRFESESLYAFPETFAKEVTADLKESATGTENASELVKALQKFSATEGDKKLVLPNGTFHLAGTFSITGMKDLYVTGSGSTTLLCDDYKTAILVTDCENTHISDITVNFTDSPIVKATVLAYDAATKTVQLQVSSDFDVSCSKYSSAVYGYYDMVKNGDVFQINNEGNIRYAASDSRKVTNAAKNQMSVTFGSAPSRTPEEGDVVNIALTQYSGGAATVSIVGGKNVYCESLTVSCAPAMSFHASNTENLYVNRLSVVPDRTRNLGISTTADGFHTISVSGNLVLTNSTFYGNQDDCLNVCATYDTVASVAGKVLNLSTNNIARIEVGDTVEIYNPSNVACRGSYVVKAVDGKKVTLNTSLENVAAGDLVGNVTKATHLTVDNCYFAYTVGRGGLIQCRDTVIKNSTFDGLRDCALRIHAAIDQFHEAIVPKNITVQNCKILSCNLNHAYYSLIDVIAFVAGTGATTSGTITGVNVKNNFFFTSGGAAVTFYAAGNSTVENNLCYNMAQNTMKAGSPISQFCDTVFGFLYSPNVTVQNNYTYTVGISKGYLAIKYAQDSCTNFTQSSNANKSKR